MAEPRDYYEVLGVARDADVRAIKDAFRTLALKFHPDRNKEPGAEARFKEIAEAYAILSDPKKRAAYDARGFAGVAGLHSEDLFGGINFEDIFGGLNFDFGAGSPFDGFFHRRRSGPPRGANLEVELTLPLERVASGGEEPVHLKRPQPCDACHGSGEAGGVQAPPCPTCHGSGRVTHSQRNEAEHLLIQNITVCPDCQGRGRRSEHPCPQCQGSGQVAHEELLSVTVPAGVEEGMALRIAGKGLPADEPGGVPGDLFVVVRSRLDARFERLGADLLRRELLPLTDAVLGTTLQVPTLQGAVDVTVPPGTQPDAVLRLKGKGLPVFGEQRHGDLYLRIGVQIPSRLQPSERALYEQLRALRASSARCPGQGR